MRMNTEELVFVIANSLIVATLLAVYSNELATKFLSLLVGSVVWLVLLLLLHCFLTCSSVDHVCSEGNSSILECKGSFSLCREGAMAPS